MLLARTHGIDMDSCIDKDSWYRYRFMVLTTPRVLTYTHGIESVFLNPTRTRGPSVARMRDFAVHVSGLCYPPGFWNGVEWRRLVKDCNYKWKMICTEISLWLKIILTPWPKAKVILRSKKKGQCMSNSDISSKTTKEECWTLSLYLNIFQIELSTIELGQL